MIFVLSINGAAILYFQSYEVSWEIVEGVAKSYWGFFQGPSIVGPPSHKPPISFPCLQGILMGVVWEWGTHYWGSLEFPLIIGEGQPSTKGTYFFRDDMLWAS